MRKIVFGLCFILTACYQVVETPAFPTSPPLTLPANVPTLVPTVNVETNLDWQPVATGIEERVLVPPMGSITQMVTLRIDPALVTFRVHYNPQNPLTTQQWRENLPTALAIVNANFFSPEHTILGMLISDGVVYGQSYTDRGGTFFVQDNAVGIRANVYEPYLGETWQQAIQAFPLLVYQNGAAYTNSRDTSPTRRTVIGIDGNGRVILMVTPAIGLSLYELSAWLPTTDLGLTTAFNLDGGGSSMLVLNPSSYTINSFDAVPAVLAVYPR